MRPVVTIALIFLMLLLAFLGFASGMTFLLDPSGKAHGMDISVLNGTPIGDFTLVGIFFVMAYGILPILSAYGLWKLPRWRWTDVVSRWTGQSWAWGLSVVIGIMLVVWIIIEIALIGSPEGFPRFLQVMMFLYGILIISLAMLPKGRAYARIMEGFV